MLQYGLKMKIMLLFVQFQFGMNLMKHPSALILRETSKSPQRRLITEKKPIAINQTISKENSISNKHDYFVWKRRVAMLTRWLHIYLSMISFGIVFFFAITGLTLNHADKFGDQVKSVQEKGQMDLNWVKTTDTVKIAKLEIVEYLRKKNNIKVA